MSGGSIVRHDCGRLIIYGQRCVCDPVQPYYCDCRSSGNREIEGLYCHEARRLAWRRALSGATDRRLP